MNFLNKESILKINSLYEKDFKLFNYEMIKEYTLISINNR